MPGGAEYQRLTGPAPARAVRGFSGKELFEIMQNSPIAAAIRDGDLPEDFLERPQKASRHCESCTGRPEGTGSLDAANQGCPERWRRHDGFLEIGRSGK